MIKNKKNVIMIVITLLIFVVFLTLLTSYLKYQKKEESNNETSLINLKAVQKAAEGFSNAEIEESMKQLDETMKNKTNKCKIVVNGEEITEKEIAYVDFVINNSVIYGEQERKDANYEIIKEYIIEQDAKEKNIIFTEEEHKMFEKRTKEQLPKDKEGMLKILNSFQMTYDEFLEFYIEKVKRLEIQTKWTLYVINAIENEELHIYDKSFEDKCKEYNKSQDATSKMKLLIELIDKYTEYLIDKAVIEYKD